MDRRGFLKVVVAGLAATAIPSTVFAGSIFQTDPYKKYKDALEMMDMLGVPGGEFSPNSLHVAKMVPLCGKNTKQQQQWADKIEFMLADDA